MSSDLFWRPDPMLNAARAMAGWREFMRTCGARPDYVYFDDIKRVDRGSIGYGAVAFTFDGLTEKRDLNVAVQERRILASGIGESPLGAVRDALKLSGRATSTMWAALERIGASLPIPVFTLDIEDVLG